MSKKIIYLLSLLMALSLVFASCKKNNGLDPNNGGLTPPPDTGQGQDVVGENGLFNQYSDIPDGEIANTGVYVTTGGNYYRNPVVVTRPDGKIFVFAEKRWQSQGAGNDVGIDGINTTDIIFKVSTDGGYKFDTQEYTVGTKATGPENSHGAPVVFVNDDKILIAATAGDGIGRTSKTPKASKIDYITGTFGGSASTGYITWGTWTTIEKVKAKGGSSDTTIKALVEKTPAGGSGNKNFEQFATQPGRGLVTTSDIYLPIVIAQQGGTGTDYELMGRMTLKSTMDGATWTVVEEPVGYTDDNKLTFGPWKETKLISGTVEGDLLYLTVPNPWSSANPAKFGVSDPGQPPSSKGTMPASEGSPGFFTTKQWYGANEYKITSSGIENASQAPSTISVLVHVQQRASQLYLYLVSDPKELTLQGKGWKLDDVGKSSTVDMMADGTIVVAAEKGGQDKNYFIRLLRYSQKYIEQQTSAK